MGELFEARDAPLLDALCEKLGASALEAPVRDSLLAYLGLVSTWNARVDLTAARGARALAEVLVADACVLADPTLIEEGSVVLDVGTGVGAPLFPLVLLRPDLSAVCVEPRRKRVAFLRTVIGQLDLVSRVELHETRIDPAAPSCPSRTQPSIACSRATFAPQEWLRLGLALAPRVIVLVAREPLPDAGAQAALVAERRYQLPFSQAERAIGIYARL